MMEKKILKENDKKKKTKFKGFFFQKQKKKPTYFSRKFGREHQNKNKSQIGRPKDDAQHGNFTIIVFVYLKCFPPPRPHSLSIISCRLHLDLELPSHRHESSNLQPITPSHSPPHQTQTKKWVVSYHYQPSSSSPLAF